MTKLKKRIKNADVLQYYFLLPVFLMNELIN